MHVSANSDLVYFTARFLRPYLLRAGKHLVNALDLKHKKDHLTVKTTKRRNKFLSYLKNLESFLVVTSVAMRFFRNAARRTSKNASFLRAYAANDQFGELGLERARTKRRLHGGYHVFERKKGLKRWRPKFLK